MIRTIWFWVALLFLTLWYGLKAIISGLIGIRNRPGGVYDQCARGWSKGGLRAAGIEVRVHGQEKVPTDRPVVYVSNHQSMFDIFALAARIPGHMRFVAKKELSKVPIFGRAARAAGQIYIDRFNRQAALKAYEEAAEAIKKGLNAVVFAEGTRSRTGDLLPFKKGPFVFAIASQAPVIPVYCAGTFDILAKGSLRVRSHPIALMFGDPIPTEGMDYEDREKLLNQTRKAIEALREESTKVLSQE